MKKAAGKNLKTKNKLPRAKKIQINVLKSVKGASLENANVLLLHSAFDGVKINTLDAITRKKIVRIKKRNPDLAKTVFKYSYSIFKKSLVFGVIVLTALSQASMFAAFESHVINVTATIENRYCADFEARTIGYWKNHEEVFEPFLPVNLGDEIIDGVDQALEVLNNHSASEARNALKAQLLALKFNVSAFGIGDYFVESAGKTVSEIVGEADSLLRDPEATRDELLAMKDLIDYINNLNPDIGCNIVINKVYYDTAPGKGLEGDNEWIELYNKTDEPVDVSGWTVCDNTSCDVLPPSPGIPAKGFAVITGATTTWDYWHIPAGIIKIVLADGKIGNGLNNDADMLSLTSSDGAVMDRMNYGVPDPGWNYYNALNVWNPGAVDVPEGGALSRSPTGYDTNQPSDFVGLFPPEVDLIYPDEAGSYTWYWTYNYDIKWAATNPNGDNNDLKINLYWIKDDDGSKTITEGDTTNLIVEGTENDGIYNWTVPSGFLGYIWIKIVAVGPENPMLNDISISGDIWDPPTPERLLFLQEHGAYPDFSIEPPKENGENEDAGNIVLSGGDNAGVSEQPEIIEEPAEEKVNENSEEKEVEEGGDIETAEPIIEESEEGMVEETMETTKDIEGVDGAEEIKNEKTGDSEQVAGETKEASGQVNKQDGQTEAVVGEKEEEATEAETVETAESTQESGKPVEEKLIEETQDNSNVEAEGSGNN
ncbi:lamin tail domain-containing protein [Candidatus Wolfebacteria bacterium]|nr:lamin tail domain-containing protein [Candidatus Wolfebacteria bacterium]